MRIYIAGPYTKGDVEQNVFNAIKYGEFIRATGHTPFIPHLTHFWHIISEHDYEYWMQLDRDWLEVCDALVRLPGESAGADREVEWAKELGLPILDLNDLT